MEGLPILEPNLNRPLRHVDFISNAFADIGCGSRVLVELDFKGSKLVLGSTLALLVLLLLCQSALARRALGDAAGAMAGGRGGRGRRPLGGGGGGRTGSCGRIGARGLGGLVHGHHGDGHLNFCCHGGRRGVICH